MLHPTAANVIICLDMDSAECSPGLCCIQDGLCGLKHFDMDFANLIIGSSKIHVIFCSLLACLGFLRCPTEFGRRWRMGWCEHSTGRLEVNITHSRWDIVFGGTKSTHFAGRRCVPLCNHQSHFIRDMVDRAVRLFMRWNALIQWLERAHATRNRILAGCLNKQCGEIFLFHRSKAGSALGLFSLSAGSRSQRFEYVLAYQKGVPCYRNLHRDESICAQVLCLWMLFLCTDLTDFKNTTEI